MSGHEIAVAVNDLSPVVDGAAQTRALTDVEHGGPQTLHVLLKVLIDGGVVFLMIVVEVLVAVVVVGVHRGSWYAATRSRTFA